jgi:hypothetical protein
MVFLVPQRVLDATFDHLRRCGAGRRECQILWTSSWNTMQDITGVVHPRHRAHAGGFDLDSTWLNAFWLELAERGEGVRIQVHTHPGEAFHSAIDDAFPIIHTPGFLSLVIPRFAQSHVGLDDAFLAELGQDGLFREVPISEHLRIAS